MIKIEREHDHRDDDDREDRHVDDLHDETASHADPAKNDGENQFENADNEADADQPDREMRQPVY